MSASPAPLGRRAAARAAALLAAAALTACTAVIQTPPGGSPVLVMSNLNTPLGPVAAGPGAGGPAFAEPPMSAPPANLGLSVPPGLGTTLPTPRPVSLDGAYRGTAEMFSDAYGDGCQVYAPVYGFEVTGRSVRYHQFRGTIDADGGLRMQFGTAWVIGQFEPGRFNGQLTSLRCSYLLTLHRTGP